MGSTIDILLRLAATVPAVLAVAVAVSSRAEPPSAPGKPCSAYRAGQDGVIRAFCTGRGVARISLDGHEHVVTGGTCQIVGTSFSFNAGVVTGLGATVTPDYVGIATPKMGAFTGAALAVRLEGRDYLLMLNNGKVDAHGGVFQASGHEVGGARAPATVSGTVAC